LLNKSQGLSLVQLSIIYKFLNLHSATKGSLSDRWIVSFSNDALSTTADT